GVGTRCSEVELSPRRAISLGAWSHHEADHLSFGPPTPRQASGLSTVCTKILTPTYTTGKYVCLAFDALYLRPLGAVLLELRARVQVFTWGSEDDHSAAT
ncbi:hypothetical protein ATANTOWER_003007, partial [Ataeniobius toweri]|nr:hypothetical protein [Ataeniobius toweri]